MVTARKRPKIGTGTSLVAHAVVLGFLILAGQKTWKVKFPQERGGNHSVLYWQVASLMPPPADTRTLPHRTLKKVAIKSAKTEPLPDSARPNEMKSSANNDSGIGVSAEDTIPAFPVFSPSPSLPDRSLLPPDTRNVVVDVTVTAEGEVSDERLVNGLGNDLDQIILNTVKTWKFHPAITDGNAVSSVAELVFPLSPKWRG